MTEYSTARHNMVESQIRTNKVTDPSIVDAFAAIPREMFVPKRLAGIAYVDEDLAVGGGRYLMEPMVLARLLQTALIGPADVVLDIGCATGYSTAVISRIASTVIGVESDPKMIEECTEALGVLEIDNAAIVEGALADGYAKQAPYDLIVIGGAVPAVPPSILDQLAEHGRLVTVLRDGPDSPGRAVLMERSASGVSSRVVFDAATPPLRGFERQAGFVF